jgi:glutathione S-transferase
MLHVLPLSYRQRALAQVEALIAQAERDVARYPAQTGKTKTQDRLQREWRRLALLYRSRQFLLSDEFSAVKAGRRH